MTIKTPEEIADERIALNYGDALGLEDALGRGFVDVDGIRAMLIEAIKAEREQCVRCIHCGWPIRVIGDPPDWIHLPFEEGKPEYYQCPGVIGVFAEALEGTPLT